MSDTLEKIYARLLAAESEIAKYSEAKYSEAKNYYVQDVRFMLTRIMDLEKEIIELKVSINNSKPRN